MVGNIEEKQGVNGMTKKKKVIIGVVLLLAVSCLLFVWYALQPTTRVSTGDKVSKHEKQRLFNEYENTNKLNKN